MKVIKTKFNRSQFCAARICLFAVLVGIWAAGKFNVPAADSLEKGFLSPPAAAKPQVWWQWMNGHITREGITRDLEAMKAAGLGNLVFLEVDIDEPPGGVHEPQVAGAFRPIADANVRTVDCPPGFLGGRKC